MIYLWHYFWQHHHFTAFLHKYCSFAGGFLKRLETQFFWICVCECVCVCVCVCVWEREQSFSGALHEVSWSVLRHSSSGFSLSLFCFFMWLLYSTVLYSTLLCQWCTSACAPIRGSLGKPRGGRQWSGWRNSSTPFLKKHCSWCVPKRSAWNRGNTDWEKRFIHTHTPAHTPTHSYTLGSRLLHAEVLGPILTPVFSEFSSKKLLVIQFFYIDYTFL